MIYQNHNKFFRSKEFIFKKPLKHHLLFFMFDLDWPSHWFTDCFISCAGWVEYISIFVTLLQMSCTSHDFYFVSDLFYPIRKGANRNYILDTSLTATKNNAHLLWYFFMTYFEIYHGHLVGSLLFPHRPFSSWNMSRWWSSCFSLFLYSLAFSKDVEAQFRAYCWSFLFHSLGTTMSSLFVLLLTEQTGSEFYFLIFSF